MSPICTTIALVICVCLNSDSQHYVTKLMQLEAADQDHLEAVIKQSLELMPKDGPKPVERDSRIEELQNTVVEQADEIKGLRIQVGRYEQQHLEHGTEVDSLRQ